MESPTRRVVYPLNSKRIKLAQLRQLAEALELPADISSANLQIMVEEKLRELECVPENVQLVVEVDSECSECLQLQDETGTFFKTATPTCSKASTPAEVQESCSLLTSSHGSHPEQSTDIGLLNQEPPESTVTETNTGAHSLQQLTGEQKLTTMNYQQLLSDAEERSAELLAKIQQLTTALTDSEERLANLASKNEQLMYQVTAYSELSIANQQLTVTLAEANERMEKLASENEKLQHKLADSEELKQELLQGQNCIKELWKKNCEQAKEFDLIIWEKDKELESLKKQLEGKDVMVELSAQSVTE